MKNLAWSRMVTISLGVALIFAADYRDARALDDEKDHESAVFAMIASSTNEKAETEEQPSRPWFRDWQGRPGGGPPGDGAPGQRGGGPGPGDGRGWPGPESRFWEEQLEHLRRVNPELADIHVELRQVELDIQRVAERIRESPDTAPSSRVENRLRTLLERQFELNLKRQRMEIEFMEMRIKQLKEMVARLEEHQERLIDMRLRGWLTGEPPRFWGRGGGPPQGSDGMDPRGPRPPEAPPGGDNSSGESED